MTSVSMADLKEQVNDINFSRIFLPSQLEFINLLYEGRLMSGRKKMGRPKTTWRRVVEKGVGELKYNWKLELTTAMLSISQLNPV